MSCITEINEIAIDNIIWKKLESSQLVHHWLTRAGGGDGGGGDNTHQESFHGDHLIS